MVASTTPLRLARALELAFPEGGMTVSGLRREIARGTLTAELIAGKHFVTLAAIDRMREACRVQPRGGITSTQKDRTRLSTPNSPEVALRSALQCAVALRDRSKRAPL